MIKLLNFKKPIANLVILISLNFLVFYNYWIGRSTPPWDFLGGGQVEQFRFYKDGSFFNPPSWFPYGWFGIPEYQLLQDGGWFLPVAIVAEIFYWNPPNAARVQAFLILVGSVGTYFAAKNYVKDSKYALLAGILYTFIPVFFSNAQHYGVVRSAALLPWMIFVVNPDYVLRKRFSILIGSLILFQVIVGSYPGNLISVFYTVLLYIILNSYNLKNYKVKYLFRVLSMAFIGILLGQLRYLPVIATLEYFPDNPGNQAGITLNNLIYLLFPFTDDNLPWGDPSLRSIYIGSLVFVLFFFINLKNKHIFKWSIILFFSTLMMMQNQVNDFLRDIIPLTNISRFAISDWRNTFSISFVLISVMILEGIKNNQILITKTRIYLFILSFSYMIYLGFIYKFSLFKVIFYLLPALLILLYLKFFLQKWNIKPLIVFVICFNFIFVLDNSLSWLTTVKEQYFNIYKKDYSLINETLNYPMTKRSKRFFLIEPPLKSDDYKSDQRYNRFWLTGGLGALGYHNIKDIPAYKSLFPRLEKSDDPIIKFLSLDGRQLIIYENKNIEKELIKCLDKLFCNSTVYTNITQIEFNKETEKFKINSVKDFQMIQNEMYSPVWYGNICTTDTICERVKSYPSLNSLRSWQLPAGEYTFITKATTPLNKERWLLFYLGLIILAINSLYNLFYSRSPGVKINNASR